MYRCYKMACAHVCNSMLQYVEYKGASYLGSDTRLAGKPAEGREHVKVHARTRKTNLQEHDRRKRKKKKVV